MAINKDKIHDLVEIFYQAPFKTFYVNSSDGVNFTKNLGVFVSLGITTSMDILEKIKTVLTRVENGRYKTHLVELQSQNISGQYMNAISKDSDIEQYDIQEFPKDSWNQETVKDLIQVHEIAEEFEDVTQLQKLITKIESDEGGWNSSMIYREKGEYKIFHKKINYKKSDTSEYRIGIYVEEN